MTFARSALAVVVLLALVGVAGAEDRSRARTAFRAGSQHYNLGEFQQALDSFKEAYRNLENADFLYNIAQCERQLGHKREAIREYRAYLNNSSSVDNREYVKQSIAQLEKQLADEDERARAAAAAAAATPITPPPALAVSAPAATATPEATTLTSAPPAQAEHRPAYKKWWVWTIVGGVVAGGAAAGLAIAFTRPSAPSAVTTLGTAHPSF